MEITAAIVLFFVLTSVVVAFRKKKVDSNTLQDWANIVTVASVISVILVGAIVGVVVFSRWLKENAQKNIRLDFATSNDSTALNPKLHWDAGNSDLSSYTLDGGTLIMTAGPYTWPNFPMVSYDQPVTDNFSAQVKVIFAPEAQVLTTAQMVGLLVRPVNAHLVQSDDSFPQDWIATAKAVTDEGNLVGCRGSWEGNSSNTVYLILEREADSWKCAYSDNGKNWVWLNAAVDDLQLRGKQLVVSLFAYSITDHSITAEFSDWTISENQR